jgi:hypothetical protein
MENYMKGDYYLLHVTSTITNFHNTTSFKAWANGVTEIARFGGDRRSLDDDVIAYQRKLALSLAVNFKRVPTEGQGITSPGSSLSAIYSIDPTISEDNPLLINSKVLLPPSLAYNMAALAGVAILTAWEMRLEGVTPEVIKWLNKAEARWHAAKVVQHLSDWSEYTFADNSNVIRIPVA